MEETENKPGTSSAHSKKTETEFSWNCGETRGRSTDESRMTEWMSSVHSFPLSLGHSHPPVTPPSCPANILSTVRSLMHLVLIITSLEILVTRSTDVETEAPRNHTAFLSNWNSGICSLALWRNNSVHWVEWAEKGKALKDILSWDLEFAKIKGRDDPQLILGKL